MKRSYAKKAKQSKQGGESKVNSDEEQCQANGAKKLKPGKHSYVKQAKDKQLTKLSQTKYSPLLVQSHFASLVRHI